MSTEQKPSNLNVPNLLTTLRIVMVPFFGWALLVDGGESVTWRLVAWAIFVAAMITDKIDGDLARKHGLVTDFGKIADPIADKAITGMAFIGLGIIFSDQSWSVLFWIAVVGPLTSLAIGLGALAVLQVLPPRGLLPLIVGGLFISNIAIGILNLVPGLPLDGGRVLKAGVWQVSGSPHRGTVAAGWGGRVTAVLVLLWPLLMQEWLGWSPTLITWLVAVMVAMFLWVGATAAMASARLRSKLPSLVARNLARRTVAVPGDLAIAESVRRAQGEQAGAIVTTASDGRPTGLVNETALAAVPDDRRPWMPVSSVARTLEQDLTLPVGIGGEDLIKAMGRRPAEEYLLVEPDGRIYGVLATADVDRAFREH